MAYFNSTNATSFINSTLFKASNQTWPSPTKSRPAPISESFRLGLYILMGCVAVTGIIGNVCVCFIIASGKKMYTIANLFLMNLAIADILVLTICYPLIIIRQEMNWPFGHVMCKILPAVSDCFYGVSMGCITAIAIYRYRMILHSMTTHMSFAHAKITMIVIWVIALGIISAPLCWVLQLKTAKIPIAAVSRPLNATSFGFGYNTTAMFGNSGFLPVNQTSIPLLSLNGTEKPMASQSNKQFKVLSRCISKWPSAQFREIYQIVQIAWYILPLSVILFTYLRIRTYLKKTLKYEWLTAGGNNNLKQSGLNSRVIGIKRALTLLAPVVVTFALLMLPWNLIRFLSLVMDISQIPHIYTYMEVAGVIMIANSCSNPFIYYIVSKEFRDEFRKRFRTVTRCFKINSDDVFLSAYSRSPSCRSQTRVETMSKVDDDNDERSENGFKNSWEKYAARVPDSPLIRQAAKRDTAKLSVRFYPTEQEKNDESDKLITPPPDPDRETYI